MFSPESVRRLFRLGYHPRFVANFGCSLQGHAKGWSVLFLHAFATHHLEKQRKRSDQECIRRKSHRPRITDRRANTPTLSPLSALVCLHPAPLFRSCFAFRRGAPVSRLLQTRVPRCHRGARSEAGPAKCIVPPHDAVARGKPHARPSTFIDACSTLRLPVCNMENIQP